MKAKAIIALVLALALAPISSFAGDGAALSSFASTWELQPTRYGDARTASGLVSGGTKNGVEMFAIKVDGKFEDGEMVFVYCYKNDRYSKEEVVKMETVLGAAIITLVSSRDANHIFPLSDLRKIMVEDEDGNELLYLDVDSRTFPNVR